MINSYTAKLPYISLLEDRVSNATKKAQSASTLFTREVPEQNGTRSDNEWIGTESRQVQAKRKQSWQY